MKIKCQILQQGHFGGCARVGGSCNKTLEYLNTAEHCFAIF